VIKRTKKKEHKTAAGKGNRVPSAGKKASKKTGPPEKNTSRQKSKSSPVNPSSEPLLEIQKTWLSEQDLQHFKTLLVEKLNEITGDVYQIESGALKSSRSDASGDLSSMPIHMADIGSDNYEQEFALGLMDSERKLVAEILAALKRIQNRTYGICEGTGNPIPRQRLEGIPWTRYCLEYAQQMERGKAADETAASQTAASSKQVNLYQEQESEIQEQTNTGIFDVDSNKSDDENY